MGTVWKLQEFSVIQILCATICAEQFVNYRYAILEALNFVNLVIFQPSKSAKKS